MRIEGGHSSITITGKMDFTWDINRLYYQSKPEQDNEN